MDKNQIISFIGDVTTPKDRLLVSVLSELSEYDPEKVGKMLDVFHQEAKYNNYLTEEEAKDITSKFMNANGSIGPVWTVAEIKNAIERNSLLKEEEPYYNFHALYTTINMYVSDQYKTLVKWIGSNESKMFEMCYDLAVNKLKDLDRPNWIRQYFGV